MSFSLKNRIFKLFGSYIEEKDSYKNSQGKGILQRYNEIVGEDYDLGTGEAIKNLMNLVYVPATVKSELIPYLQDMMGAAVYLGTGDDIKRKLIRYGNKINNLRGTRPGFEILFKFLGFNSSVIIEHLAGGSFDDGNIDFTYTPLTFDENVRTFDTTCPSCSDISIQLFGTIDLTDDVLKAIYRIVDYNKPIDVNIRLITYNGNALPTEDMLATFIDFMGNLNYNNDAAPTTFLSLDNAGDLNISGNNAGNYTINPNGDLEYDI